MPDTVPEVIYWILMGANGLLLGVLTFAAVHYLRQISTTSTQTNKEIVTLRDELRTEREDRITHYGNLTAQIASHRAVCDERHRIGRRQEDGC